MLRVLARPKWIAGLLFALLFLAICLRLGQWQWHRHEFKVDRADRIHANYASDPVPLGDLVPRDVTGLPTDAEWRRVSLTGEYLPREQVLVRNRPHRGTDAFGTYGYEVLVPLRLTSPAGDAGRTVMVDRGWVPNAETAEQLPEVPPPPGGAVEVTGWLRHEERSRDRTLPEGQAASIALADVADAVPGGLDAGDLAPTWVALQAEMRDGVALPEASRPLPLDEPDTGLGNHQAYAYQWWGSSVFALVFVLWAARRQAEAEGLVTPRRPSPRTDGTGPQAGGGDPDDALSRELSRGHRGRGARPRPKRQWIWDEEDE